MSDMREPTESQDLRRGDPSATGGCIAGDASVSPLRGGCADDAAQTDKGVDGKVSEMREADRRNRVNHIVLNWWKGLGMVYKGVDLGECIQYDLFSLLLREL